MANKKGLEKDTTSHAHNVATEMEDEISFWLAKSVKSVSSGSVELFATDKPALKIEVINNKDINKKINVNFLEPELFNIDIAKDEVEDRLLR